MNPLFTIAEFAFRLINVFEALRLKAYKDSTGTWTNGYGHTKDVHEGQIITRDQALQFFTEDSNPLIIEVKGKPVLEAGPLVSFGYNCGLGTLRRVLKGEIIVKPEGFLVGGKIPYGEVSMGIRQDGLVARRRLEASLVLLSRASVM